MARFFFNADEPVRLEEYDASRACTVRWHCLVPEPGQWYTATRYTWTGDLGRPPVLDVYEWRDAHQRPVERPHEDDES